MPLPKLGEKARSFRLPSAQGGEVALDDYKGRSAVVLWFTKGMACPFCRQQMSQLARAYPRVKEHGGEILEVTNTPLPRAQFYARQFALPFPYLCDPDFRVRREWGLEQRSHGPGYYVKTFIAGAKSTPPPSDYGGIKPALGEFPSLLTDEDMGVFIVDRAGVVRYALAGAYFSEAGPHGIPGADEIVRELERCSAAA
jgi:peroxiredoxin